jgi:hypothetical protein
MLEKQIEQKVCDYARDKGLLAYKFTSPSRAAVPDRLMVTQSGRVFLVEFKREGQKATPAQEREHQRLRGHKIEVFVIDDVQQGRFLVDLMVDR